MKKTNRLNDLIIFILIIFILIILLSILLYNLYTFEKFTDIQKPRNHEEEYLLPILRLIYNDNINFTEISNELILTQDSMIESNTTPYIFMDGEPNIKSNNNYKKALNDIYCVACIVTSKAVENEKTFYVPMFLNRGHEVYTSSPFIKKYLDIPRNKLAAYIANHSPKHRSDFFNTLKSLDTTNTTDGLGKANHTNDVKLPSIWYYLPEIYKDYKFGLAMENTDEEYYITEKIMNVFLGGAIPIYWGTSKVKEIFNPESFIYINDYISFEECAKDIIAISNDEERYKTIQNAPIFIENTNIDFSKYYDIPPPQWVIDIADKIKQNIDNIIEVL